jgi:hypothetical protein
VPNATAAPRTDHQERESAFFFLLRKRRILECDKICNSGAARLSICKPGPTALSLSVSKDTDVHLLVTWALHPIPAPLREPIPREQPRDTN